MNDKVVKCTEASDSSDLFVKGEILSEQGKTLMYVSIDNSIAGIIAVADIVKPSSKKAIES